MQGRFSIPNNLQNMKGEIPMKIDLSKQECRWLADLANKAKIEAELCNEQQPHPILQLRRDNMACLENKLNTAIQKEIQKGRRQVR